MQSAAGWARRIVGRAAGGVLVRSVLPWLFLFLVFLARFLPVHIIRQAPDKALWPDSASYLEVAHEWVEGRGIAGDPSSFSDLYRSPGYPAFLAVVFRIAGENYTAVVVVQLLLGVAVSLMHFALGRMFWSPRVGYVAALLYALTPNAVLWALAILSDTLFVFLIAAALLCLGLLMQTGRTRWAAMSGVCLGLGALTRPAGQVLLPLWILGVVVWAIRRRTTLRQAIIASGALALASAALILPWAYRNQVVHGLFTLSPIDTRLLGYYSAPYTLARAEGISEDEAREQIPTSVIPQPGDRARYLRILLDHPLDYLYVHWRGTWYLLSEVGQPNQAQLVGERYHTPGFLVALRQGDFRQAAASLLAGLRDPVMRWFVLISWPSMAFQLAIYLLALKAAFMLPRQSVAQRIVVALAVLAAAAFILIPGPVGNGRFRLPAEPFLCLLAGVGFWPVGKARGLERKR
jgi:4-amino-4-deoxy-L-arabinose transferase-like glycosyltransferase